MWTSKIKPPRKTHTLLGLPVHSAQTATIKNWKNHRPKPASTPEGTVQQKEEGNENTKDPSTKETTNDIAQASHNETTNKPAPPTD